MNADELLWKELHGRGIFSIDGLAIEDALDLAKRYAVWIPVDTYVRAPWLAPYAVRRARIRNDARVKGGERDMWGFPDDQGYFTDDNSLIKQIHKGKRVTPGTSPYQSIRLSGGMICCHVWAGTTKNPLLFSFVPNLVWLPKSLAPLSDNHDGGEPHPVHTYLQAVSVSRFGSQIVEVGAERVVAAWDELGYRGISPNNDLSYELTDHAKLVRLASGRVTRMIKFLEAILQEGGTPARFSKRYHAGVGKGSDLSFPSVTQAVSAKDLRALLAEMKACQVAEQRSA